MSAAMKMAERAVRALEQCAKELRTVVVLMQRIEWRLAKQPAILPYEKVLP